MNTVAIVAALDLECAALEKRLRTQYAPARATVTVTGIGAQRAIAAVQKRLQYNPPSLLLHVGFAGGLDPALAAGDVLRVGRVLSESGQHIELDPADGRAILLTADNVADSPARKAQLFKQHLAAAVDMETFHVAQLAQQAGVKMIALRAISDPADTTLPAACVNWVTHQGQSRPLPAALYALTHPWQIPSLIDVAHGIRLACRNLTHESLRIIQDELP